MKKMQLGDATLERWDMKNYGFILPFTVAERSILRNVINNMCQRCYSTKDKFYSIYGGRGITVCEEWRNPETGRPNYPPFFRWCMDNGWQKGLQIDRIDNDKGYSPDNCRLVEAKWNCRNRRSNRMLTFRGETKSLAEWGEVLGISAKVIEHRLSRGMSIDEALTRVVTKGHEHLITYKGETKNVKQWAESVGISSCLLIGRLKDGWSMGKALKYKAHETQRKKYLYDGRNLTLREWAKEIGMGYAVFVGRVKKWGLEQAITTPLMEQFSHKR